MIHKIQKFNLRCILRNASRRTAGFLNSVASKVRWDERQRLQAVQEEKARRDVQEVDDEVDQNWTAVCEWTAKKMLKFLEDREFLKVSESCLQTSRAFV